MRLRTSSELSGPATQMRSAFYIRARLPWRLISLRQEREPLKEQSMTHTSELNDTSLEISTIHAIRTWLTSVWAKSSQRRTRLRWSDTQSATPSTFSSSWYLLSYLGYHLLLLAWISHRFIPHWPRSDDPLEVAVRSLGMRSFAVPGEDVERCSG